MPFFLGIYYIFGIFMMVFYRHKRLCVVKIYYKYGFFGVYITLLFPERVPP